MAAGSKPLELDSQARALLPLVAREPGYMADGAADTLAAIVGWCLQSLEHLDRVLESGLTESRIVRWFQLLATGAPAAYVRLCDNLAEESVLAGIITACRRIPAEPPVTGDLLLLLLGTPKARPDPQWLGRVREMHRHLLGEELRAALIDVARLGEEWERRITLLEGALPSAWRQFGSMMADPTRAPRRREIALLPADPLAMTCARGAMWFLSCFPDAHTRDLLEGAARAWARSALGNPMLGQAAIAALALPADAEAGRRLLRLQCSIAHRSMLARISEELQALATEAGTSPEALADEQTPRHGLDTGGTRTWPASEYAVTLHLAPNGAVETAVTGPNGRRYRSLPSAVRSEHQAVWSEVKAEAAALRKTVSAQRARLEEAMIAEREWDPAAWQQSINAHPILGHLARRLVWQVNTPDREPAFLLPVPAGGWVHAGGQGIDLPTHSRIAIAHPIRMPDEERARWRKYLVEQGVVQPFKQLFRETYALTPAERAAGFASSRFAGQPVTPRRVYALARGRGWSGALGMDGFDGAGIGYREFPAQYVRARLELNLDPRRLMSVESVGFERSSGTGGSRRWERLRLDQVPPVVFSEAMRDIDLLVSVSSTGNDLQWQRWEAARRRGEVRWADERERLALLQPEVTATRAALLALILPQMRLEDAVVVDRHFAVVTGTRGRYRVHLGTGNIHVEPDGRYLCIVPAYDGKAIVLPFEDEDVAMSAILSKISLLARDDRITDPSILAQLPSESR